LAEMPIDEAMPLWIDALCIYSYQTTIKDLRILKFVPQFLRGLILHVG
jgi:hypothetical protein